MYSVITAVSKIRVDREINMFDLIRIGEKKHYCEEDPFRNFILSHGFHHFKKLGHTAMMI